MKENNPARNATKNDTLGVNDNSKSILLFFINQLNCLLKTLLTPAVS